MTKQEFIDNINSEVFNYENKLSFITNFKEIPGWDSMTTILLIDFFLNNFNIQINNKDLDNLFTIEDLYKLLTNES